MKKTSFHVLRVGLAITFLWIGILILKQPEAWAGYVDPWVIKLLPVPIIQFMIATAIFDILIGFFLLVGVFTWLAALIGGIHIATVLVVSGITDITVRDIGLIAAAFALAIDSLPRHIADRVPLLRNKDN